MKVCVVSHSAVVDAYREKFHALAGAEPRWNFRLALPAHWPEGNRTVTAPASGTEHGVGVKVFPVRWSGKVGGFFLPGLAPWLRAERPDILHLEEEPYALAGWQAVRALLPGARVVFFTWENIFRTYKPPLRWIDRWMLKRADWALAGNHEAADVLRQRGFGKSITVLPQYGVNPAVFAPAAHARGGTFTLGYMGRLLEEKGIHTLLAAAACLTFPFRLIITGEGDRGESLRAQAARLGLQAKVTFRSAVPHAGMPAAYRELDALVLPSETRPAWKEQFGRVLTEAMACGVPVVGSDSGEIPHVIGDAGLVFPEGDAAALAERLTRLHASADLRRDLAARGRERVLANFTTAQVAQKTLAVYRQLAGKSV
jgi:glycosyltransferase involved in cell wall biosynthesis